jgi:uncharacterized membrane protein
MILFLTIVVVQHLNSRADEVVEDEVEDDEVVHVEMDPSTSHTNNVMMEIESVEMDVVVVVRLKEMKS